MAISNLKKKNLVHHSYIRHNTVISTLPTEHATLYKYLTTSIIKLS